MEREKKEEVENEKNFYAVLDFLFSQLTNEMRRKFFS